MAKLTRRRNKYNAKKTEYMGIRFDSADEALRYSYLLAWQESGAIRNITLQPKFPFVHEGQKLWDYVADFSYWRCDPQSGEPIQFIVEDVKSDATEKDKVFLLKKKAFLASSTAKTVRFEVVKRADIGSIKLLDDAEFDKSGEVLIMPRKLAQPHTKAPFEKVQRKPKEPTT